MLMITTYLFISLLSFLSLMIAFYLGMKIEAKNLVGKLTALSIGILLLGFSSHSAIALPINNFTLGSIAAQDSAISKESQNFEEVIKSNPSESHYTGLEYAQKTQPQEDSVSDDTIAKTIKSDTSDGVTVAVANGSVRLSGTVEDKSVAKDIIENTKNIPGVHEITFDFGLDN